MRKTIACMFTLLMFQTAAYAGVIILNDNQLHSTNDDSNRQSSSRSRRSSYPDNYQKGYKEGYTYNEGGIREIAPIPPIAPIPNVGETTEDAYTRGILDGRKDRQK